ncbi:YidC/Oxa1 family membrane protein insertase [Alicyclobacillus tolerans]|uniref:YidC/Oxa1 family membrane protein insertase n=2 Tax=Alicyclobacillus tolerans TaxID=90970 RepID=A0ABT9LUG4_9BACL|nr:MULTISPECIES: YidC/Oxa1 family membrane protein insertase [Alicyclobacillus]MDP9727902.1 YidC/Oxa1 family membrane protein insertase [Alicyclobacillus tengchongensis]QRF24541.1 membrane protein insertase YidC [Alicyclobacillus sp. TC]SHK51839.1 YidC/Oxa1 family membrane protein insertase [Alicyclobacillus montanus]
MAERKPRKSRWLWALSAVALLSVTGCGLYPAKPGDWPHNAWGDILKFVSSVLDFFAKHAGGYGISLLIVTFIVRLIIFPLMINQLRSMRKMQELQPQMQKIRSQFKGDNKRIQEETMKLYQTAGVNPLGGCFPLLLQLPIIYALYGAIYGSRQLHEAVFLGVHLGQPDPNYIFPILAALTQLLSTWLTMRGQPTQQKAMLFVTPIMVLFIGLRLPSGLALYWIYTNIFTSIQTWLMKYIPEKNSAAKKSDKNIVEAPAPQKGKGR